MIKIFLVIGVIVLTVSVHAQVQIGQDIDGEATGDQSGISVSMPDAVTVAIGACTNSGNGHYAGQVRIYTWNGADWWQKGEDIDGEAEDDEAGVSVSMPDANTVAIGAPLNDGNGSDAGQVRIYTWNGSSWQQKGADIDGEAAGDHSGWSVSMPDTNTLAIGAYFNDGIATNAGHVRIYTWNGLSWQQKGVDIDGEAAGDFSGWSVNMPDSNTVAIGAIDNDGNGSNAGHVRIYSWNGLLWVQKGADIDGEAAGDFSGCSVSMPDSNTLAIGAYFNDGNGNNSGHVRIYTWNGLLWVQKGDDIDGEAATDISGFSVSMPDSNTVAIGAHYNSGNGLYAGHVRIYTWNGSAWIQKGIDIDGEAADDKSGYSVNMPDTNTVAIGAIFNDGNGTKAGHVRIYSLCNTLGTDIVTACDSYTWIDGNTYTASNNTATYTLTNAAGCDSIITLNLTINHSTTSTDVISACNSYTWMDGNTYTESNNTATYTLTNAAGCDSVITLDLTINTVDVSVTNSSPTLTANALDAGYQWLDCNDNMAVIPGEINQSFSATADGSYAVEVTQYGCIDTSACETVNIANLLENDFGNTLVIYPNPTEGTFSVDLADEYGDIAVIIRNYMGQEIDRQIVDSADKLQVSVEGVAGIYFIEIKADTRRAIFKVIKE